MSDPLRAALVELLATVKGECPSLLDEDSGGSAALEARIVDALAAPTGAALPGWKIEQQHDIFGTVIVTAPNGYVATTNATSRNPENVLRMLALAALAAPTGAAPAALPQEVYAWRDAKLAEIAALDAYNARVLYARQRDEVDGFGRTRVDAEFQAWTAASNTAHAALKAMIAPLFAALIAPTEAAPAGEALLREALELAIPYLEADSQCGYDGTNGSGIRQEAQRRLDIARAALAAPTGAAPEWYRDEAWPIPADRAPTGAALAPVIPPEAWRWPRRIYVIDEIDGSPAEQAAQQGLENCRLYAARHRKEEWAKVILRLCKAGGAIGSPLRKPKGQP